jgi:hypothetical protein
MSELITNKITPGSGSSDTVTMGDASDTFNFPSGVTVTAHSGATVSGFGTDVKAGTAQATTSGTSVTFSSIPTGTKRIDVIFNEVSENTGQDLKLQIGDSGGIETSSYNSKAARLEGSAQGVSSATDSFIIQFGVAGAALSGVYSLFLVDSSNHDWVGSCAFAKNDSSNASVTGGGFKSLSAELTQLKVLIASGAFDAGEINIHYWS